MSPEDITRVPVNIKWTPELDEELERSIHNGLSYTQIAIKFHISRCAVAGRLHRLRQAKRKRAEVGAIGRPKTAPKRLTQTENGE
jgi:hypothetical protein